MRFGSALGPEAPLFAFRHDVFLRTWKAAVETLNFGDPTPYRLRHGGATHDRATGLRSLRSIKKRGRWHSDASVRRYEKRVRMQVLEAGLSPSQVLEAKRVQDALPRLLA